jgi:hypothetical protein
LIALYDANVLYPGRFEKPADAPGIDGVISGEMVGRDSRGVDFEFVAETARPDASAVGADAGIDGPARGGGVGDGLCRVDSGAAELPDPNDRHVLAAAIRGRAQVIVTLNPRDFPKAILVRYGIVAQHPDSFVLGLLATGPDAVVEAAEYFETLGRQGLGGSVEVLRRIWVAVK